MKKIPPVSTITTTLVSKMISMSLRRMGVFFSDSVMALVFPRGNDLGRPEQLRTDRKSGEFRRLKIDSQPDFFILGDKPDHDALSRRPVGVTDGQNIAITQC